MNLKLKKEETDELLSIQSFRKIDKANSISFKSKLYSIYDANKNRISFKEKTSILILETLDGRIVAKYHGEIFNIIETNYKYLTNSQKEQYKKQRRITPNFSTPDYHPLSYKIFMLYLYNTENLKRYLKK